MNRHDFSTKRLAHWEQIAQSGRSQSRFSHFYQRRLHDVYALRVPPGSRVLEIGCGCGDLLATLNPALGLGVDFSPTMIKRARERHSDKGNIRFLQADGHEVLPDGTEPFDFIVLSDLLNDVWDVQGLLEHVRRFCQPSTRLVLNIYSHLWELPLRFAQAMGLATPVLQQNWLTIEDVKHLFDLSGWEGLSHWTEVLLPWDVPGLSDGLNRVVAKMFPGSVLALSHFLVARPRPEYFERAKEPPSVSVIVPARNEAGNVKDILSRVPLMGSRTELVFVEGNSTDDTRAVLERELRGFTRLPASLHVQTGKGKGDAVRLGFSRATGDILMILDADLTVAPEDLPRFYEAIVQGKGDFINGVRLVYPMEEQAMRFLNLLGNKFFSLGFSWVLGQDVKDTLCGTKVLWRRDYERIAANRAYFGDFDPFGDFDLLFGAAKLNLKILDLPIRYGERIYGETNIDRWRHGWLLLKMLAFGGHQLKFV